jgi:hypothetical protein
MTEEIKIFVSFRATPDWENFSIATLKAKIGRNCFSCGSVQGGLDESRNIQGKLGLLRALNSRHGFRMSRDKKRAAILICDYAYLVSFYSPRRAYNFFLIVQPYGIPTSSIKT